METQVFRHSVIAYLGSALRIVLGIVIATLLASWINSSVVDTIIGIIAAIFCIIQVHKILDIFFEKLIIDEEGVWRYRGYLPWTKGIFGRNWEEIGDVVFIRGFFSWMFQSYTVVIESKYRDKSYRILLDHINEGDLAVTMINNVLSSEHRV